jgi:hypothetical protein
VSDRNIVFRSFSFFIQVVYSIASIERYLQLPPRVVSCRLTQIIKDDQQYALTDAAELIRRSIVNTRVTIYVEGQQMKLNHSTNIVTAFQQELNLFMTL